MDGPTHSRPQLVIYITILAIEDDIVIIIPKLLVHLVIILLRLPQFLQEIKQLLSRLHTSPFTHMCFTNCMHPSRLSPPSLPPSPTPPHPAGKDLVPEQEVKVQEAAEARRQPARERPYTGLHVPVPALPDHPSDMGRLGLFQRSKHAGQQLHAGLLSLVLLPTPRFNAEID